MSRGQRAQGACRGRVHVVNYIGAVSRARGECTAGTAATKIRLQHRVARSRRSALLLLEGPLLFRTIDLAQVVDASVGLRGGAGFHEVGNGDRRQEADDGHDDHDFNEGEAGFE